MAFRSAESYWHSGEQLLEVVSSDSLTFGNDEAGFPYYSLEDTVQQLIIQSVKESIIYHFVIHKNRPTGS